MESKLKPAYRFCQDLARRKAGNFYYSFQFLPGDQRRAIYAVYAFCQQGDHQVDEFPPEEAKGRLENYQQDFEHCLQGDYKSPLFQALGDSIIRFNLTPGNFRDLLRGMSWDIDKYRYDTFAQLREYCRLAASTVGSICVEIFSYENPEVLKYAENLGIALQLTNILRDIKEDYNRGRIYIPLEDMNRFSYSEEDLANGVRSGNFLELMESQYQRAVKFYDEAENYLPAAERKREIAAEIMKTVYRELLEKIRIDDYPVFDGRVSIPGWRKMKLALKTYVNIRLSGNRSG
ncbi:squalene/phytoene synthase family protein [bacterium]|nr:squalene/phytoene synthase family protein [bacterium]